MYFPAEHLLNKLKISVAELRRFEEKGIVQGISKAGHIFYSSRDMYRLKAILAHLTRGLPLEEAKWHVDHPTEEAVASDDPE